MNKILQCASKYFLLYLGLLYLDIDSIYVLFKMLSFMLFGKVYDTFQHIIVAHFARLMKSCLTILANVNIYNSFKSPLPNVR